MKAPILVMLLLLTMASYSQFKAYRPDGTRIDKKFTTIQSVMDSLEMPNAKTRSVGNLIVGFYWFSDSILFALSDKVLAEAEVKNTLKSYKHDKYISSPSFIGDLERFFKEGPWSIPYVTSVLGVPDKETKIGDEKTLEWDKYRLKAIFSYERLFKAIVRDKFSGSSSNFVVSDFQVTGDESTIGCRIEFFNNSRKNIKYLHFTIGVFNRVDDRIGTKKVSAVGPVSGYDFGVYENENIMYSKVSDRLVIDQIRVQYMDGTEKTYPKAQIEILRDHVVYAR